MDDYYVQKKYDCYWNKYTKLTSILSVESTFQQNSSLLLHPFPCAALEELHASVVTRESASSPVVPQTTLP